MPFLPSKDAEPFPGYRLLERVGAGGYAEVWSAVAPGDLTKAIKIVYGEMGGHRAEQELKALRRIKEVRHPFLLSLERIEVIDGQLLIVMELAERSLLDRYNECREAGLPGIPRDELLAYARDAADALDFMWQTHGLQHSDIKPPNLLLVGGRVKVADFGLVKEVMGSSVSMTGGVTPVYAPPEAFDGRLSRHSDQYSLAIVYQEMLTGVRPFPGATAAQLAAQHTSSPPLLDPLPATDRPLIARALAKAPEQRFPTSRELVEQLLRAGAPPVHLTPPPPGAGTSTSVSVAGETPGSSRLREDTPAVAARVPAPWPPASTVPVGRSGIRPTLFLGVGGTAATVLRRLRRRLHERFGGLDNMPVFRLLFVDTDAAELRAAQHGEASEALSVEEVLPAPLRPAEHYRGDSKSLLRWLDRRWLYNVPRSLQTEGLRPLGRLALVDNAAAVVARLREAITQVAGPEARAIAAAAGLGLRNEAPRVFLVTSLAGGTGGGMLFSMAYAVRQVLAEYALPADGLCGLLLYSTSQKPAEKHLARVNATAALRELEHFFNPASTYPGDPDHGLAAFGPGEPPLADSYLVHLGEDLGPAAREAAADSLAEYLYLDAVTGAGAFLDRYRQDTRPEAAGPGLRTFGLSRIGFPRYRLAEQAANLFCQRLVERWRGRLHEPGREQVEQEVQQRANAAGLDTEPLAGWLHAAAAGLLGEDPTTYFHRLLADSAGRPSAVAGLSPTEAALQQLDTLLGTGRDRERGPVPAETAFEAALEEQARELGALVGRSLLEWLHDLVEDPGKRLAGAGCAADWLLQRVPGATQATRQRLIFLRERCQVLRQQVAAARPAGDSGASRWLGRRKRQPETNQPDPAALEYCGLRLEEVVREAALVVLGQAQKDLSQFAENLMFCRRELARLGALLQRAPAEGVPDQSAPLLGTQELVPGPTCDLPAAAATLLEGLSAEHSQGFDEQFQAEVLDPAGGLWALVTRSAELIPVLREELWARARSAMLIALADVDAAGLFLNAHPVEQQAGQALRSQVRAARPVLAEAAEQQQLVLAVPDSPAGAEVRQLLAESFPDEPLSVVDSDGDVVVCYEAARLSLSRVAAALFGNPAAHAELARRVLTRLDVPWESLTPIA